MAAIVEGRIGDTVRIIGVSCESIGKRVPLGIHGAHNDWLQKNRSTGERIVGALREAAAWSKANPAGAGAILGSTRSDGAG